MRLELPALRGYLPVGFMAGLGLARLLPPTCRLGWEARTQTAYVDGIERDALLDLLCAHMVGRAQSPELAIADDVRKFPLERFRALADSADANTLAWVRSWWREDGDATVPTDLCLTGGPQRMLKMARELAAELDPSRSRKPAEWVRGKFAEALFGPWRYEDDLASWGWDPASFRSGAFTSEAPTDLRKEGVAGAYWLAWEAQPFLPCLHGQGTVGFVHGPRAWTWATWAEPLDAHAVAALIFRPDEAVALGGVHYASGIVFAGQMQFFEPGRPLPLDAS